MNSAKNWCLCQFWNLHKISREIDIFLDIDLSFISLLPNIHKRDGK